MRYYGHHCWDQTWVHTLCAFSRWTIDFGHLTLFRRRKIQFRGRLILDFVHLTWNPHGVWNSKSKSLMNDRFWPFDIVRRRKIQFRERQIIGFCPSDLKFAQCLKLDRLLLLMRYDAHHCWHQTWVHILCDFSRWLTFFAWVQSLLKIYLS